MHIRSDSFEPALSSVFHAAYVDDVFFFGGGFTALERFDKLCDARTLCVGRCSTYSAPTCCGLRWHEDHLPRCWTARRSSEHWTIPKFRLTATCSIPFQVQAARPILWLGDLSLPPLLQLMIRHMRHPQPQVQRVPMMAHRPRQLPIRLMHMRSRFLRMVFPCS